MTLSDLQGHSPIASLFRWDFHTVLQQLTKFQSCSMLHSPSVIAEPLVNAA